jgi:uncharacterized SAM-binding protein YcdF (DUF218 family)
MSRSLGVFRKLLRAGVIACALLGALVVLVTVTPAVKWPARLLAGDWRNPKGGVLIVLGGGTVNGRALNLSSYWRALYGVLVWRGGGFREVVVSGEGVAPLMRDFMTAYGVPGGAIRVEDRSLSTRENALYVKQLLRGASGPYVLLTSDFHMFRAARAFRKAGLAVEPCPFPDALKSAESWRGRWPAFLQISLESLKIGYYYAHGWI